MLLLCLFQFNCFDFLHFNTHIQFLVSFISDANKTFHPLGCGPAQCLFNMYKLNNRNNTHSVHFKIHFLDLLFYHWLFAFAKQIYWYCSERKRASIPLQTNKTEPCSLSYENYYFHLSVCISTCERSQEGKNWNEP